MRHTSRAKRLGSSAILLLALATLVSGCGGSSKRPDAKDTEGDPQHQYRWAFEQFRRGYYKEALEAIDKAIELEPGNYDFHNMRGLIYLDAGSPEQAIADFETVLEINPYFTDGHNNMGAALAKLGRGEEAEAEYKRVLDDPRFANKEKAYYNLGDLYLAEQRYDDAVEAFRKAIVLEPNHHRAYFKLGKCFQEMGMNDDALDAYEEVLRIAPQSNEAREIKLIVDAKRPS